MEEIKRSLTINEAAEEILRIFGYDTKPDNEVEIVVKVGMRGRILPVLRMLWQTAREAGDYCERPPGS